MSNVLIGFMFIIVGGCLLYFCNDLVDSFGSLTMIEKYMTTRAFYLILGCVLIMIGVWYMFGVFNADPNTSARKTGFGSSII